MSHRSQNVSSARLDWPRGWGKERPLALFVFGSIFFTLTALISVPYAIDATRADDDLKALYGIAFGLVSLTFVMIFVPRRKVRRAKLPPKASVGSADAQHPGLNFPYISSWKIILSLWLGVGAVLLILRSALLLPGINSGENTSLRSSLNIGALAITLGVLTLIAVLLFYLYGRRGNRSGRVVIDEDGVLQELGQTTRFITWDDIGDVFPCIVNNSHMVRITPADGRKISVDTRRSLLDRWQRGYFERIMDVPVWVLGIDPPLFLYTVRFYWQNPAVRDELRTEAAIERMRNGELIPGES